MQKKKSIEQNSLSFHNGKKINKLGTEEYYLNIIKAIYEKLTTNIIFNGES
jgi:hypothetical protein